MRWSAAGTTDAGAKTSSWCASSASGSSATACPCTGLYPAPRGDRLQTADCRLREALPTMSVCQQVPVVIPGELGGPGAERQRAQPWRRPAPHRPRRPASTTGPGAVTGAQTPVGRIDTTHTWHEAPKHTKNTKGVLWGYGPRAALVKALFSRTKESACRAPNRVLSRSSSCPLPSVSSNVAPRRCPPDPRLGSLDGLGRAW